MSRVPKGILIETALLLSIFIAIAVLAIYMALINKILYAKMFLFIYLLYYTTLLLMVSIDYSGYGETEDVETKTILLILGYTPLLVYLVTIIIVMAITCQHSTPFSGNKV